MDGRILAFPTDDPPAPEIRLPSSPLAGGRVDAHAAEVPLPPPRELIYRRRNRIGLVRRDRVLYDHVAS